MEPTASPQLSRRSGGVLPITEEERAIARDILPTAHASRRRRSPSACITARKSVRGLQRLRLDHATEPVANHKPSRRVHRPQRVRFPGVVVP
jgi:hypothetical protein